MKKIVYFILFIAVLVNLNCAKKENLSNSNLLFYVGETAVSRNNSNLPVKVKLPLDKNDILQTGADSSMTIQSGNDLLFKILEKSNLCMTEVQDLTASVLRLDKGTVLCKLPKQNAAKPDFKIKTETATVAVRGTEFSVSVNDKEVIVAVKGGKVEITRISDNESRIIEDGKSAVITKENILVRDISEQEKLTIEKLDQIPFTVVSYSLEDKLMKDGDAYHKKDIALDRQISDLEKKEKLPLTLEEIRKKHGILQEITLFTGRTIKGAVLERGSSYKIIIPGQIIYIKADEVENVRKI